MRAAGCAARAARCGDEMNQLGGCSPGGAGACCLLSPCARALAEKDSGEGRCCTSRSRSLAMVRLPSTCLSSAAYQPCPTTLIAFIQHYGPNVNNHFGKRLPHPSRHPCLLCVPLPPAVALFDIDTLWAYTLPNPSTRVPASGFSPRPGRSYSNARLRGRQPHITVTVLRAFREWHNPLTKSGGQTSGLARPLSENRIHLWLSRLPSPSPSQPGCGPCRSTARASSLCTAINT